MKKESREIAIPGEKIISGREYLPGDGTARKGEDIVANVFGLVDISNKLVKVLPLSGIYEPRVGNTIIGRIEDVTFSGWLINIRSPYSSYLPVSEYPKFIKGDLTEFLDIGDMVNCKVTDVKRKGIDLTVKGPGLGKIDKGIIMYINSNKVPRVIGKEGSMIKLIKQETNCKITVGQNGIVWISGENFKDEIKAKETIEFITEKSYINGLTDKVKEWLENKK